MVEIVITQVSYQIIWQGKRLFLALFCNFYFREVVWQQYPMSWFDLDTHYTGSLLVITNFDPFKLIKFKHQIHLLSPSIAGLVSTLHTPKFTDEEGRLINVFLHNIPSLLITYNYNSSNSLMLTDIEVI